MAVRFPAVKAFALAILATATVSGGVPALAQQPATAIATSDYVLGPDDKLHIIVYGEENLTGDYAISPQGQLSFPFVGEINVVGKTISEAQEMVRERLAAGYVKQPKVAFQLLNYRSFYILGEVNKPGLYPYQANLTVDQAVATAGGYTYRAKKKQFILRRANEATERRVKRENGQTIMVQPGDTITIRERFF